MGLRRPQGLLGAMGLVIILGCVQVVEAQDSQLSEGTVTMRLGLYDGDVVKTMPGGWGRADGAELNDGSAAPRLAQERGERVLRLRDDPRVGPYELVPDDGKGDSSDVEP